VIEPLRGGAVGGTEEAGFYSGCRHFGCCFIGVLSSPVEELGYSFGVVSQSEDAVLVVTAFAEQRFPGDGPDDLRAPNRRPLHRWLGLRRSRP
jgi:hypothetical protein